MADTVTTSTWNDGSRKTIVMLTSVSDGTGESAVTKVDISGLSGAPSKVRIAKVCFSTRTMGVDILFEASANQFAFHCPANYAEEFDFEACCGGIQPNAAAGGFVGDIKVTTIGHASGARYWIVLVLIKD